jgi:methylated-DNA-[protein]-cysteine S-methyltransferase
MEKYSMECFFAKNVKRWVAVKAGPVSVRSVKLFEQRPGDERMTLPVTSDLQRYFKGEKVDFSSYDVDLSCFTPFQQEVLTATRSIHWGTCITYSQLASMVARPKAVRAVGNALGSNRVPVIIPCHRIVSKHGHGGYSLGAGLKLELLRLESIEF